MSIINDALKKTQQARKNDKSQSRPTKLALKPVTAVRTLFPQIKKTGIMMNSIKNLKSAIFNPEVWFTGRMAVMLTLSALLILAVSHYVQRQKLQNMLLPSMSTQAPHRKAPVAFEGIFVANDNARTALINKKPMHLGDNLNGMKIIAINKDTVHLQHEKEVLEIKAGATYEL